MFDFRQSRQISNGLIGFWRERILRRCISSLAIEEQKAGGNSACMALFLQEISVRYPNDNIVMVLDGAGRHKSLSIPIPDNLRLQPLPPYSPELNPVEHLWDGNHPQN